MKIEITPQELIQLMASFRADTLAVARGIGSRGEDIGPGMFVTGTRTPDGPDFSDGCERMGCHDSELTEISPAASDHKEQGYYQSTLDVPGGDAAQSLPLVQLDNSATLPTLADPRSAAEITVTPPAKRTRKKKPVVESAPVEETPPATAVFGGVPVPSGAADTPTPPAPPALPGVPAAPEELSATGKFMNAAIDSIRAQRMTHEEVMAMLRTHGINNFAELKDNEGKIPAILAELK